MIYSIKTGKDIYYAMKETIYQGKKTYMEIDTHAYNTTGEIIPIASPITADSNLTVVDRFGFEITYLAYLFDVFDQLGGQKYKVFKYIVEHKSSANTLIITQRELAQNAGVSLEIVRQALKLLREKNLIATRTGAIMLLPKIAHFGGSDREQYLMHQFKTFND